MFATMSPSSVANSCNCSIPNGNTKCISGKYIILLIKMWIIISFKITKQLSIKTEELISEIDNLKPMYFIVQYAQFSHCINTIKFYAAQTKIFRQNLLVHGFVLPYYCRRTVSTWSKCIHNKYWVWNYYLHVVMNSKFKWYGFLLYFYQLLNDYLPTNYGKKENFPNAWSRTKW